jgi:hypothetical protein
VRLKVRVCNVRKDSEDGTHARRARGEGSEPSVRVPTSVRSSKASASACIGSSLLGADFLTLITLLNAASRQLS